MAMDCSLGMSSSFWLVIIIHVSTYQVLKADQSFHLTMPGTTSKHNAYFCFARPIPNPSLELYLTSFETQVSTSTAHHVLVYGCSHPLSTRADEAYECGKICNDDSQIVYAWARAAPALQIPEGVAFRVGAGTKIRYLVLQVHYLKTQVQPDYTSVIARLQTKPLPFAAGIFLMLAYYGQIPGNSKQVHLDVACRYTGRDTLYPFAFRTHAHSLGRAIVAYRLSPDLVEVQEIGRGSPQWPQSFYPSSKGVVIRTGDFVAARCVYDSMGRQRSTVIGSAHSDEMCNFYMMYFTRSRDEITPEEGLECGGKGSQEIWSAIPNDSLNYLPMHRAGGEGPKAHAATHNTAGAFNNGQHKPSAEAAHQSTASRNDASGLKSTAARESAPQLVPDWPKLGHMKAKLGQVSGIAVDNESRILLFHRGPRTWQFGTFNFDHTLSNDYLTPLSMDAVVVLDSNGQYVHSWGSGLFFMPHGITVDTQGNVWLTDVGSHEVHKFKNGMWSSPALSLGQHLIPGRGRKHFCQPSDVAVTETGEVFVADGYCNERVVKLDADGNYLSEFKSAAGKFEIPHSLAIDSAAGQVCVADRERAHVECFDFSGRSQRLLTSKSLGESVYAIAVDKYRKNTLYAVNGPGVYDTSLPVQGFTMDLQSGDVKNSWGPSSTHEFTRPHDLALSPDGQFLYVAEIGPNRVWKFRLSPLAVAPVNSATQKTSSSSSKATSKIIFAESINRMTDSKASFIIGLGLVVPVILLLMAVACVRANRSGFFWRGSAMKNRRYGPLFRERNGFQPLNQEDSDPETENLTKAAAVLVADPKIALKA